MRVSTTWLRPAMLGTWTQVGCLEPILFALGPTERRGPKASDLDVEDDLVRRISGSTKLCLIFF